MKGVAAGGGRENMGGAEEGVHDEFGTMESPNGAVEGSGVSLPVVFLWMIP